MKLIRRFSYKYKSEAIANKQATPTGVCESKKRKKWSCLVNDSEIAQMKKATPKPTKIFQLGASPSKGDSFED